MQIFSILWVIVLVMVPQGKNTYIEKKKIYLDTEKRYFKELVHILWGQVWNL